MGCDARPLVFVPGDSEAFRTAVADALGVPLSPLEERSFVDGEHKSRPLVDVRARAVVVVHRLAGDARLGVNDKLVRLLFLLATLRDAGAAHVTAVLPYLPYARKDRRTQPLDPVSQRYLAQLLEAVGTDRVVALDVHNVAAFQNAFRCETVHLEAADAFADAIAGRCGSAPLAVVSPDAGGMKRADTLRAALDARTGGAAAPVFLEKRRSRDVVSGEAVVGSVAGRVAVIVDDLVAAGTTLRRAITACVDGGARGVIAAVTHGLFVDGAEALLAEPGLERLLVTDSVASPLLERAPEKLQCIPVAPLLARAVRPEG